jgi:predicted ester cyclase
MNAFRHRRLGALVASLLTLSLVVGCGGKRVADADKRRSAEYLRAFLIERDWQRWPDYFAPNATLNGSDLALQIMRGTADGLNYSFADLRLTIREQIAEPPRVATAFVLDGLHERPFNDLPPTHQRLEIEGFAFDRFDGDKIVESRLFLDVSGLSQRAAAATARK